MLYKIRKNVDGTYYYVCVNVCLSIPMVVALVAMIRFRGGSLMAHDFLIPGFIGPC